MSGILGIWNVDGEPVSRELLQRMSARMAHRGPDGETIWIDGEIGLAVQLMKVTPESEHESQPLSHPAGLTLVFDGRLDNRQELLSKLPASAGISDSSPDPDIVLAAYRHFGADFLKNLIGDIALALWDRAKRRLFLARDIMGARTLYYCRTGNAFLFATEIKALLAHPLVKTRPNDVALAEYFYRYFDYRDLSKTFFEGIFTVPPAHVVLVSPGNTRTERFTDFQPSARIRFKDDREYVEGYKDHFLTAVRRRLRSSAPVACMASGGQDSSSIFCSALTLKAQSPESLPECFGVSAVPESPEVNELGYQQTIEKLYGVELIKVPLTDFRTVADAQADVYHTEAPFLRWHDWKQISEQSHLRGARVVLSGFFGDQILLSPQYYLDLAQSLRWITLKEHFNVYSGFYDWAPRSEHRRNLLAAAKGYAIPPSLRPLYHWLKRRFHPAAPPLAGFSSQFAAVASDLEGYGRVLTLPRGSAHARALYNFACAKNPTIRVALDSLWESKYQVQTAYPFRDRDLISFLMAIPGEKVFYGGVPRGIHCAAMRGILPEEIRLRRTKADFSGIARQSALADLNIFEANVGSSSPGLRMGYLKPIEELKQDLGGLRKWLESDTDASSSWETQDIIWLDLWLSVFFPGA